MTGSLAHLLGRCREVISEHRAITGAELVTEIDAALDRLTGISWPAPEVERVALAAEVPPSTVVRILEALFERPMFSPDAGFSSPLAELPRDPKTGRPYPEINDRSYRRLIPGLRRHYRRDAMTGCWLYQGPA